MILANTDGGIYKMEQTQSETIGKLATALAELQGSLEGAIKDATNPFFNSKYADLESVWECCRTGLALKGFAVIQTMGGTAETPSVITTLAHTSGEWIRGELLLTPDKKGPQGIGSCITYGRRYSLAAIVGIIQVDDDAEGATDRKKKQAPNKPSQPVEDDIPMGDMPTNTPNPKLITEKQRKRMFGIGHENNWPDPDIKILIGRHGFESSSDITKDEYPKIVEQLERDFNEV